MDVGAAPGGRRRPSCAWATWSRCAPAGPSSSGGYAACKSLDDRAAVAVDRPVPGGALAADRMRGTCTRWPRSRRRSGAAARSRAPSAWPPTAAIALDATFGLQPGLSAAETVKMDGGTEHLPWARTSTPACLDRLVEAAKGDRAPLPGGAHPRRRAAPTPGASRSAAAGVPCALVGIPVQYMHTPVETVCLRDIERAARLPGGVHLPACPSDFAGVASRRATPLAAGKEPEMLLEKLSEAHGVSGHEEEVRAILLEEIRDRVDACRIDTMGNLIAFKKGTGALDAPHARRGPHGRGRAHDHRGGGLRHAAVREGRGHRRPRAARRASFSSARSGCPASSA